MNLKNRYINILKKFILLSAGLHIFIIIYFSIIKGDITYLNYFKILELNLFFPHIMEGFLSQLLSALTIISVLSILYIRFSPKINKKT